MANLIDDKFSFFVPATIEKGKSSDGTEQMTIRGIANSESATDSDGETLEPMGFDYDPLLKTGFFNWDHQSKKTAAAIVGEPTLARVINKGRDFYVEGFLYPDSEEARSIYKLGNVLQKNSKTRRLGFSIEGQVIERGCGPEFLDKAQTVRNEDYTLQKWSRVKKARITGIAITPCPKNPNTYLEVVKGEYSVPLMTQEYDEEIIKAMEVDQKLTQHDPSPEVKADESKSSCCNTSIEDEKCVECGQEVGKSFKKSEIYELIANQYTTDVEKAKQIYSFIKSVNQKLFPMSKEKVSQEAITKAFEFLNAGIEKSETTEVVATVEENKELDPTNVEKATDLCKSFEGDLTKGQVVDKLVEAGYAEDTAFEAAKGYKKPEVVSKKEEVVIQKSLSATETTATLEVRPDKTEELIKGLSDNLGTKFSALGSILKATLEQNDILKGQFDQLAQTNTELLKRLEKVEETPFAAKSIRNVSATERFAKSQGDEGDAIPAGMQVLDLNKSQDVSTLTDVMFEECVALKDSGKDYTHLEKAISGLEIAKQLPASILPWARSKGFIIRGGK